MSAPTTRIRAAVVGVSGYTGAECLRLLRGHPNVELTALCAGRRAGDPLESILPPLAGLSNLPVGAFDPDAVAEAADFAFLCLPHRTAQEAAAALMARGVRVIDLSADHRFDDPVLYGRIYGEHKHPESLAHTVYGLPERDRRGIREARLIGCPGCYPTSVWLAAGPAVAAGLVAADRIIADCKSGVSGAGRNPSAATHFGDTAEGLRSYKALNHRHAPEMATYLSTPDHAITVHFVPHLVPMNRGILASTYIRLRADVSEADVRAAYAERYADEPFVTLLPAGHHPDTRNVRGTNRAHVSLFVDGDLLLAQSVIDNLTKGSSGQAIQCMNLMAGLPEETGLDLTALYP